MENERKKNRCMMNVSCLLAILLIFITGFVIFSYHDDDKEEGDITLSSITALMNIGGSLLILITVVTKNYSLYCKLRIAIYLTLFVFTGTTITYCFLIIRRGTNYDDLVCFIVCYVIYCLEAIFALMLYMDSDGEEVVKKESSEENLVSS